MSEAHNPHEAQPDPEQTDEQRAWDEYMSRVVLHRHAIAEGRDVR
ncbi:hypothetical protein AB0J43_05440 [Nonomuraea fuscirosea]